MTHPGGPPRRGRLDPIPQPLPEVAPAFVEPVGYDPAIIPAWSDGPLSPAFAALRLEPWRLYVQPAAVMLAGAADQVREWRA